MRDMDEFGYASGRGWKAVQLPYVGGKLAMLVIVPDDLAAFEATLDQPALAAITDALQTRTVNLALPKFATRSQLSLGDLLSALGMPTAFTDHADFSGITTEEPLLISAVVHQADIDVDEQGTEASAATAVMMRAASLPLDVVDLTVDRPFLFALRDLETGAVVFLGADRGPDGGDGTGHLGRAVAGVLVLVPTEPAPDHLLPADRRQAHRGTLLGRLLRDVRPRLARHADLRVLTHGALHQLGALLRRRFRANPRREPRLDARRMSSNERRNRASSARSLRPSVQR